MQAPTKAFAANPRIEFLPFDRHKLSATQESEEIIVFLVLNVESWPFDRPMPRELLTAPHGTRQLPDVPNFCWAEYGLRAGLPRILRLFRERGIVASVSLNASVIDAYPACFDALLETGWELIGHGIDQVSLQSAADERTIVEQSVARLEQASGRKVRGWLSPGLRESYETPDILAGQGIDYVCDWGLDDRPNWMSTSGRPLIAMPYSLELNDSVVFAVEKHRSDELYSRLALTPECLSAEAGPLGPRVLGMGLHPHLMGVPHRFVVLERMLDLLCARPNVRFMSGSQIADWFIERQGA